MVLYGVQLHEAVIKCTTEQAEQSEPSAFEQQPDKPQSTLTLVLGLVSLGPLLRPKDGRHQTLDCLGQPRKLDDSA